MVQLALRITVPLGSVLAAAALLLLWLPALPGDDGTMLLGLFAALLAAGLALSPLLLQLAKRAAEADTLAARVAAQEAQIARAERQQHETLERLSHDLRTPLASMQGYLELLLLRHGSVGPGEALNYLQTAARHSERLSRLVSDLFELSRLEADTARLQSEPFQLAELAHDVAQRFADAAARAQVALGVRAQPLGAAMVVGDIALAERLLGNLVENALAHTPAGGSVTLEIDAAETPNAVPPDARALRITVVDTGVGIADLDGIFDRYATASRTGDTGSRTAGLGLAIARRIAALHGSALKLQSAPGAGTRVGFTLPRAR